MNDFAKRIDPDNLLEKTHKDIHSLTNALDDVMLDFMNKIIFIKYKGNIDGVNIAVSAVTSFFVTHVAKAMAALDEDSRRETIDGILETAKESIDAYIVELENKYKNEIKRH